MASAARLLRLPERQMKNTVASASIPASCNDAASRSANAGSSRLSGKVCHSAKTGRFDKLLKSGRPTNAHSARVRTSTKTVLGSDFNRPQVSLTETSATSCVGTLPSTCAFKYQSPSRPVSRQTAGTNLTAKQRNCAWKLPSTPIRTPECNYTEFATKLPRQCKMRSGQYYT